MTYRRCVIDRLVCVYKRALADFLKHARTTMSLSEISVHSLERGARYFIFVSRRECVCNRQLRCSLLGQRILANWRFRVAFD